MALAPDVQHRRVVVQHHCCCAWHMFSVPALFTSQVGVAMSFFVLVRYSLSLPLLTQLQLAKHARRSVSCFC